MYAEQPRFRGHSIHLSMYSPECLGPMMRSMSNTAPATAVNVQNLAWFYPFRLWEPVTYVRGWVYNGTTANGNWDVGVYDETFTLLQSVNGSLGAPVGQSGTSVLQASNAISWTFAPGRYYVAMSSSSATATFFSTSVTAAIARAAGVVQAASAHVLPANPTEAAFAQVILPHFGLSRRTVIA